jgi:hypothetical protein
MLTGGWFRERIHLDSLGMDLNLLAVGTLPTRHFRQGVVILFTRFEFSILGWLVSNRLGNSILGYRGIHWRFSSISMMLGLRSIRVVEVLCVTTRRITSTAAVTAALEALATATAARESTTAAANDAPENTKDDETTENHNTNHWPFAPHHVHTVVPAGKGSCEIFGCL